MAYYPNYYNPYMYQNQSYATNNVKSLEWVSGKVGAEAYQMPAGWEPEKPIALWDSTDKKIFLKSWNNMGMPNPLQELDYEIKERANPALLPTGVSGEANPYITKDDLAEFKQEIKNMINNMSNRNNNRNGGDNR